MGMRLSELSKELGYKSAELAALAKAKGLKIEAGNPNLDARLSAAVRTNVPHRSKLTGPLLEVYLKAVAEASARATALAAKPREERPPASPAPGSISCLICEALGVTIRPWGPDRELDVYTCPFCGQFAVDFITGESLKDPKRKEDRHRASAVIYERRLQLPSDQRKQLVLFANRKGAPETFPTPVWIWEDLIERFPTSITRQVDRSLANLIRLSDRLGADISLGGEVRRATFSLTTPEMNAILDQLVEEKFLQKYLGRITVTAAGWKRMETSSFVSVDPTRPPTRSPTSEPPSQQPPLPIAAAPSSTAPVLPDRYKVLEKIGAGSSGDVYKVQDLELDRLVALKILPRGDAASTEIMERFLREARALAKCDHPNVTRIHDVVTKVDRPFIVMEHVAGKPLRDHVSGSLPTDSAINLLRQVAAGLECAHQRMVIHRDLSPNNVLVSSEGIAKIIDFGWTKGPTVLTVSNMGGIGTLGYISPEQQRSLKDVDHRTDVYSFGCLIYFALTGADPGPAVRLRSKVAHLNFLFEKCVEENPDDRPQSMREVVSALSDLMPEKVETRVVATSPLPAPSTLEARRFGISHGPGGFTIGPAKRDASKRVLTLPLEISTFSSKVSLKELRVLIALEGRSSIEINAEFLTTNNSFLSGFFTKRLPWSLADNESRRIWIKSVISRELAMELVSSPKGVDVEVVALDHTGAEARSGVERRTIES